MATKRKATKEKEKSSSGAKKFWLGFLAFIFAGAFVTVGVGSSWFTNPHIDEWFKGKGQAQTEQTDKLPDNTPDKDNPSEDPDSSVDINGGLLLEKNGDSGISLMSTEIPVEEYEANGISELTESAFELKAILTPSNATNVTITFSSAWSDASSEWATEKDVSEYLTVKQSEEDQLTATVECLQAFGEQIVISISATTPDTTKTATCTVDYLQRFEDISVSFGDVVCNFDDETTNVIVQFNPNGPEHGGALKEELKTSIYSITNDFEVEYFLEPCAPVLYDLQIHMTNRNAISEMYVFGTGTITTQASNSFHYNEIQPLDYTTLTSHSVKNLGLNFGMKFFSEHLGFLRYSYFFVDKKWETRSVIQYSYIDQMKNIYNNIELHGDGVSFLDSDTYDCTSGGLDLFTLRVKVAGKYSSIEKVTTFHIGGYTVSLDDVAADQGSIVV